MNDRICVVTGANRGIGKAIAAGLAQRGAGVVMVCRDARRAELARCEVSQAGQSSRVEVLLADLSSLAAIHHLAAELETRPQIHVLINNAGVALPQRRLSADGLELTWMVNYLAPFLLTHLLLNKLRASAPARIINMSSLVHRWGRINLADLQGESRYHMDTAYNQSKLALVLWSYELSCRLNGTGVTVNSMEPGMTATDFGATYTGFKGFMNRMYRPWMASPEQAAQSAIHLALAPELADVSGQHFVRGRAVRSSRASYDQALARRLWQVSQELTQIVPCEGA